MSNKTFRRGQLVTFLFGTRPTQGVVKEDRGPIGLKGRVLCLIEFRLEGGDHASHIELPAERLTEVAAPVTTE